MKIRIARLATDSKGMVESSVGKCAAMVADVAEAITVDAVEIVGLLWLRQKGIFQAELAIGGYDSTGAFRADPARKPALVAWNRDQYPQLWEKYGLNDYKAIDFDAVSQWLHAEGFLDAAGRDIWREPNVAAKIESDTGAIVADYRPDVVARYAYVAPIVDPIIKEPIKG